MTHADVALPRRASLLLIATAVLSFAPHTAGLPLWLSGLCAVLLGWQAIRVWSGTRPAGRLLRLSLLAIALAAASGVRLEFGYLLGKSPGIAMLAVLLCLKLLEGSTSRDIRAGVLLAFFLQLSLFFDNQTLPVAMLAAVGTLAATTTLVALEDPQASSGCLVRSGGVLLAHATPFLIALFLLFPRLPGPLWGLPQDAHEGRTGLSEEMTPGSIAELGLSGEIALRARFDGELPPTGQRYWRGPVLSEFDGRSWRVGRSTERRSPAYPASGPAYEYVLTLEPHYRRWLLALDYPAELPERNDVGYMNTFALVADLPVKVRMQLPLTAHPEAIVGQDESAATLAGATRLPDGVAPRTRALVAELVPSGTSPQQAMERVLEHFRVSALTYTVAPPLMGDDPVDEFLFDARRGFCEHFASAFAFMMRAAGVPARIVTGYLGGTVNSVDGTLVVRQSDAHAWTEVWMADRGWLRVDPTALAVPARIQRGLSAALPEGDPRSLMMREGAGPDLLRAMRDRWEAVANMWNRNVLAYDQSSQNKLLARLGFARPDWRTLGVTLAGVMTILMLSLIAWACYRRPQGDALDRLWRKFGQRLARRGLVRLQSEGPIDYAERASLALPASAAEIRRIAALYAQLRYGAPCDDGARRTQDLANRIREFSPQ